MIYTPAFWCMAVANLCQTASFSAFFLLPLFVLDEGGSQGDVGLVMGAFALASACCRPWVSEMIDRIGRKRSYTIGSSIMFIAPLLYLALEKPVGSMFLLFLTLRIVHGVGMAICFTGVFTYMADILPEERLNEGIGIFGISGLIGIAVGPLLAEATLAAVGFKGMFLVGAGLALVTLLAHQPLAESCPEQEEASPASFFSLLARGKFIIVGLVSLLFGLGLAGTSNFVAPLAEIRGLGLVSIYYACYAAGAIATRVIGGRLADRFGENRVLPYGLGLYIIGLLLLPLATVEQLLWLAGACAGAGHGLLFPSLNAMAVRGETAAVRGKATGIFTGGIDTGSFAGALLLGYIGDWFGLGTLFVCAGLGMAVGLLLFRFRRQPQTT